MITELLHKYKDQKPKDFGSTYIERMYPVSAVIAMLEEIKQPLLLEFATFVNENELKEADDKITDYSIKSFLKK